MRYKIIVKIGEETKTLTEQFPSKNIEIIQRGNNIKLRLIAPSDLEIIDAKIYYKYKFHHSSKMFLNGYQSWTDTYEYNYNGRMRDAKRLPNTLNKAYNFDMYGDAHFTKYLPRHLHGFDFAYIKDKKNPISIATNNSNNAFLLIDYSYRHNKIRLIADVKGKKLKKGEGFTIFDYDFNDNIESMMANYDKPLKAEKIFGYTSWYNHYQNINSQLVNECLDSLDQRFNLFQIDDGYETFVGDWLDIDKKKFPEGLEGLVKKAHDKKLLAGIWLAPFVAETKSRLYNEHPEYFVKDEFGKPIRCGGNWSGFYALDLNLEEVRAYIKKSLEYYMDMGFDFFKLDFLYALGVKDNDSKTRAERTMFGYKFLREVLKDKLILGCGAVIAPAYGLFDYMRIGPDVSLKFDDVFYMKFMHRERISTKVTLRNTIYRSVFDDKLFKNDPDVFLLRDDNIELSFEQRKALITINALFGSVLMTSDNIAEYDETKKQLLDYAFALHNRAHSKSYEKKKNKILIKYTLDNVEHELYYYTHKGIIEELK